MSRSVYMLAHDLAGNNNGLKCMCRQTYAATQWPVSSGENVIFCSEAELLVEDLCAELPIETVVF